MPERYPLEDLASLPSFYHPAASPDGTEVAVYYDGTGRNELYLLDPETGEMRQLSDGNVPRNARYPFRWCPSGERLYVHRDEGGDEQNDIAAIDRDGAITPVVENDAQCVLTDVSPDGRRLLYVSDERQQMNLYEHDRETGETTRLTAYRQPVRAGLYDPEGDRVAYVTNETADLDNLDCYVLDRERVIGDGRPPVGDTEGSDDGPTRRLPVGDEGAETQVADWHPDGDRLLLGDNSTDRPRCGVYDLGSDEATWVTDEAHVESPTAVLADGSGFLATRTRECAVVPVVYDLEAGTGRELDLPEGVASFPGYGDAALLADGEVLVTQETPTQRPALLVHDPATDGTRTLLAPEYGDLDPSGFADAEYVTFESHDGLEIEALVSDSGRRPSPAVVKVHGGPAAQDRRGFDLYTQFLVSRGYSVLRVNYRGSTGRGRTFKNRINDDWGGAEQGDLAAGARWLADREWIDADRIAVFGGSYGGYSAYMQLLQYPELYAAGIAWIGMTDLAALYEDSMPHFRTALEKYLGDPEEDADRYRERSPVTHVENLAAPLCIVHGVNDPRVPIEQARLFRDALAEAGYEAGEDGDFEYTELGEEGHGSTDIDQQIRAFRVLADFLERRVPVEADAAD